ncbi:MAG: AAA family ATPase [Deltaproteobacteria bacterium]|nr:AAA family ATPase [Deltaproteobacteria bacterium]
MQISGFYIDGFGIYHNQGIRPFPPGLVLFLGDNECGKTTLMEFIRTMLFDFPPPRAKRNDYKPQRGGNHGGRLQLVTQDCRRLVIERIGRQATISMDGGTIEKADLAERFLGGLDRQTFEHVFAIGLTELQRLEVLSEDGVRRRLFAAGAGLGAESLPSAVQTLDKELKALLRKTGRKPLINQLVHQINQTRTQIAGLQELSTAYARAQERKAQLQQQIRENRQQLQNLHQDLKRLEQLEQARPSWVRLGLAREKAASLKFAENFPPDGLKRFDDLKTEIDHVKQNQKASEDQAALLQEEKLRLSLDLGVLSHQPDIEALLGEREKLAAALKDYPLVKSATEQAEAELHRRLQDLGPDWDSARIARLDTSVQVRQQAQELGRSLAAVERRYEQQQAHYQGRAEAEAEARRLTEEAQAWLNELPLPRLDEAQWQQQQQAVRLLRPLLQQRELATNQFKDRLASRQDHYGRREALQRQIEAGGVILPWWLLILVCLAGLGLAGWLIFQHDYLPAIIASLAGIGLSALLFVLRYRQLKAERHRVAMLQADLEQVEQTLRSLEAESQELDAQLESLDADLQEWAKAAGFEQPPDSTQLELRASQLEEAAADWREWQDRHRHYQEAQRHWQEKVEKLREAEQQTQKASQEMQRRQSEWQNWLAQRRLAVTVRPEGFDAVLQAVESARVAERAVQEYRQRLTQIKNYISDARQRIGTVIAACGRTPLAAEIGVEDLEALRRALEAALKNEQQRQALDHQLAAVRMEGTRLANQLQEKEDQLKTLLKQAHAADEDEFRRLATDYDKWRAASREIEDSEIALRTIAGSPQAQCSLEKELARTDSLQLEAEKEQLENQIEELEESLAKAQQEVGGLDKSLLDMARNEELGKLLWEQRCRQEQLADATRRWGTLVICNYLLEQARCIYERERQPQVIQEAGRFLGTMTGKRYRLVSSADQGSLRLEDENLGRKEPLNWSSGLADQVYLALRLGLAREFGRHSEPLPVILDDVLVKFDPHRQQGAARVMLEFSKEHQVLFFSCHPQFKELIQKAHQDYFQGETQVSYYTIRDGIIVESNC